MTYLPVEVSGAITVALIVVLGIFIFPWVLRRRAGRAVVAVSTVLLAALFILFESARGNSDGVGVLVAGLLGAAPALAAAIVTRLQRAAPPSNR
jgi:hypothetical protein